MKSQILSLILIIIIGILSQYAFGQINAGGTPISFSLDINLEKENIPVISMSPVDARALIEEDEKLRAEDAQIPFRFGYAIDVDIDIKKVGIKTTLVDGGNLWQLKIHCPDAYSINLIYSNFRLAKGSKFFIYNKDRTMILGAFTPEVSNNPYNEFATDLVQGNTIVLEYYEPASSDDGIINISKVIHGYVNTFSRGLDDSAPCNVDVMCPLGNNWTNERRAVTMILVDNNTAFCSGCLVNNTSQDLTPYILTARHCFFEDNGNTQFRNPATSIFRFLYWRHNCGSGNLQIWHSITGATLLAHHVDTDMAFLQLNSMPPASWYLYYAGWDRDANAAQGVTGIHHPRGDAMKLNYEQHSVVAQMVSVAGFPVPVDSWLVPHFEEGTVQSGSSGSPLFNQNKRIVGMLSATINCGTDNACACLQNNLFNNRLGWYGRFHIAWPHISDWLDPLNVDPLFLDGRVSPTLTGTSTLICYSGGSASFTLNNAPAGFTWSTSSNLNFSSTGNNSIVVYAAPGCNSSCTGESGWVSVNYNGTVLLSMDVWLGKPSPVFYGPENVFVPTTEGYYGASPSISNPSYYWWIDSDNWVYAYITYTSGNTAYVYFPYGGGGDYTLYMSVMNSCGADETYMNIQAYNRRGSPESYITIYPNPASDVIHIEIDSQVATGIVQRNVSDITFEVCLYDVRGNLLRHQFTKGGVVQFRVSDLPMGVYYLHVYDGVSNIPEIQQVIIER